MEQEEKQLKITDYKDPEKINTFKETNEKNNIEMEEEKKTKSR